MPPHTASLSPFHPISVDWIFSHDLDAEMAMEEQAANAAPAAAVAAPAAAEPGSRDGTKYKLVRGI